MKTIFSRIIDGEIPSYKIAEDESHFAFLDINPIAEGHTLVVPKKEIDYLFDLPDELYHSTLIFARKVAKAIDQELQPLRTGIIVQGLEVAHAHIHLIPLYSESQTMALGHNVDVSKQRMEEVAAQITNSIQAG